MRYRGQIKQYLVGIPFELIAVDVMDPWQKPETDTFWLLWITSHTGQRRIHFQTKKQLRWLKYW